MKLSAVEETFVLHWGEMGTRWGVNRSVAQIHGLLYLAARPVPADEIVETLGIARSNVSTSLRELQSYGLVRIAHVLGDRRDHFVSLDSPWDIFNAVVEERKRREIDPTLTMLRQCVLDADDDRDTSPEAKARIEAMMQFVERLADWYGQVRRLPRPTLEKLVRMGSKVASITVK